MWPKLTRRRVFGGCLLLFGALFLGLGVWQQSSPLSMLGVALWIAALVGIGILMIQRINALLQLSGFNRSEMQELRAAVSKSTWLARKCLAQTTDLSVQLNSLQDAQAKNLARQASDLGQIASKLDALCNQLTSDQSTAASWRQDHSEQATAFRNQFADFVGSVAEWMAIAEAQAKQSVAEIVAGDASAIQSGVETLLQRLDSVDDVIANVHQATQQVPGAIAAKGELIDSISRTVRAMVDEARSTERENILETVQARLNALNGAVTAMQQISKRTKETAEADSEQIRTISKTVKSILPAQRTEIARARIESVKEVEAILQLQAFLAPDKPMPLLGGWAMEPVSMLGVVTELTSRQPQLVLECGSGTSTLWIAKALKRMGKGRIVSLEHLEEHHAATSRALLAADLDNWVDLRLAPLRTHRIGKEKFKWYDLGRLDLPENSVDFLLIDGPPQDTGPLARYPALPLLEALLAEKAVIVLDDANRPEEIEEAARWLTEYPGVQEFGDLGERTKLFTYSSSVPSTRRGSAHLQAM